MNAGQLWFDIAVPSLIVAFLVRAIWAMAAVEASTRWLIGKAGPPPVAKDSMPWLVVLLPMLREQSVIAEAVAAFAALEYPPDRAAIVIITTAREDAQRQRQRVRLLQLAARPKLTPDLLRGVFPAGRCREVAEQVNVTAPARRSAVLAELFDAEPTTAHIAASLAAESPGPLAVHHAHQPAVSGRKAGQLNFALDQLEDLLAPLGWTQAAIEDTFIAVYDADAVPDVRTLQAFASAAERHRARTGSYPALIQQQRLPLLARRPFPPGPVGLLLTEEWIYQLRRSLGIELARLRLHQWLAAERLPRFVKALGRPMIYGVGCGLAVHLPAIGRIGGFPEPMEDLGTGHRLSLLGAAFTASQVLVLDEPYTEPAGLTNLHALAFVASGRPDLHARATAKLPRTISSAARATLVLREWADEAAWLIGAPAVAAAVASSWMAGPVWALLATAAVFLHGPLLTARLLAAAPRLYKAHVPPPAVTRPAAPVTSHPILLIAASPLQPFTRLAGPWALILRKVTGRQRTFGKTER